MRAEELTAQFGIAGILDFKETADGLAKAMISLDGRFATDLQRPRYFPILNDPHHVGQ